MKDWSRTLLTLRIEDVHLGIDVTHIQMVVGLWNRYSYVVSCKSVPSGTALVHQGRAIPVLNLRQALGVAPEDPRNTPVLVVLDSGERTAAVAARPTGLVRLPEEEREPLDESVPEPCRIVLAGFWKRGRRRLYLLDEEMAVQCAHSSVATAFLNSAARLGGDSDDTPAGHPGLASRAG